MLSQHQLFIAWAQYYQESTDFRRVLLGQFFHFFAHSRKRSESTEHHKNAACDKHNFDWSRKQLSEECGKNKISQRPRAIESVIKLKQSVKIRKSNERIDPF